MTDLTKRADEELLAGNREKNAEVLLDRYKNLVRQIARSYFLVGAEPEDLIQEGMIGLYKAVRDYRPDRDAAFRSFAELCVERQMISAVKRATRRKHEPLNTYVSYDRSVGDDESGRTFLDLIGAADGSPSPEDVVIGLENRRGIQQRMDEVLSPFEKRVLSLYLSGDDYGQIASVTGKSKKSVDNALQRIKKKLNRILGKD
ncbi:MAG: RNA polymerase sporulation sigma factor SigH [Eubacteriales bacterium]|nr:RNA polymerase sporulation sigma factor SigH [Eubacteriales bacterium]